MGRNVFTYVWKVLILFLFLGLCVVVFRRLIEHRSPSTGMAVTVDKSQIIEARVRGYFVQTGKLPDMHMILASTNGELFHGNNVYCDLMEDGWKNPFIYTVSQGRCSLISAGADRVPHTPDDLSWTWKYESNILSIVVSPH
jgi:hypothetical protein